MHITPPADDYGLQRLKGSDAHSEVKETGKVEPYPRIESSEERHEPTEPMVAERRGQQRRKQQRRKVKARTTVDTRSSHERRGSERREGERDNAPSGGIDDFV